MRIGIIGYGKMGKTIESLLPDFSYDLGAIIDLDSDISYEELADKIDVAIEFTAPNVAENNVIGLLKAGVSVVSGTTGWEPDFDSISQICGNTNSAFFYASNFSIGVNIFLEINKKLASLISSFPDYKVKIEETHHVHKLDKPSGTAISLAEGILENHKEYIKWVLKSDANIPELPVDAFREGEVFGDHNIIWENEIDKIEIMHSAKSRKGFATGAIMAAAYIKNKTGIFTMKDLLNI
jgi:4-hydroxy-tetrahydrodipicolinate reductase